MHCTHGAAIALLIIGVHRDAVSSKCGPEIWARGVICGIYVDFYHVSLCSDVDQWSRVHGDVTENWTLTVGGYSLIYEFHKFAFWHNVLVDCS
ncbi:hypothetical protein F4823DRAFT_458259 [Ustulina deusta]|nr:hypothetical protein F4823DRAFT_458259 [Ustulina deusta]